MPGLAGCVSNNSLDIELLPTMVKPMLHRSTYRVHPHTEEKCVLAAVDLEQDRQNGLAESQDGRYVLAFYGVIYELWAHPELGTAINLLERWNQRGWKALSDLNGEYLIAIWDRADERLTIINDRLGLKRLNYWHSDTNFAFASEAKSLAVLPAVSRAIDEYALSELLTFGHLQDDRTILRDVKFLPPGSYLTWHRSELVIHRYWYYVFRAEAALENSQYAIDEFAYHLQNAVERRIRGHERLGILLSGGLDSRTLTGFVRKIGPTGRLLTWTCGHGHDHDTRYARQIARAVKSEHTSVSIPPPFMTDYGPDYTWMLDGCVSLHGSHRSCVMPWVLEKTDVMLIGYLGDTMSGGKPMDSVLHAKEIDELIKIGFKSFPAVFDDELMAQTLRPEVYQQVRGFAFEAYAGSVRRARTEHMGDRAVVAELEQRQRLWNPICQMDLMSADCYVATPFADKDFIDFCLRLPTTERFGKKAYRGMICQKLPQLARISRSGDGLPLIHSRFRAALHWRRVLFDRHLLPKLTGGKWGGHDYGSFVHCADWFRSSNRDFIEKTLIDNPILEDHFQMDALNLMVESFLDNTSDRDLMYSIAALMSYALFREKLDHLPTFDGKAKDPIAIGSFHGTES